MLIKLFSVGLILLCSLNLALAHNSDNYVIQIGIYRNPPNEMIEQAKQLGVVNTLWVNKLTYIIVGEFDEKSTALVKLNEIRQAGFSDAFVRHVGHSDQLFDHEHNDIDRFNLLTQELNAEALYLNGKMHIRQDTHYISIP